MKTKFLFLELFFIFFAAISCPNVIHAQVQFNEIMYDASGTDTDHEWVEIYNPGSSSVDITGWKFNDGSNHTLNVPPVNGGVGSMNIPAGGYVILAASAIQFLADYPSYAGTVIDTVMSLNNTGDTLILFDKSNVAITTVTYTTETGAAGDGNSLQRSGADWGVGLPTPGAVNNLSTAGGTDNSQSGADADTPEDSKTLTKPELPPRLSAKVLIQMPAFTGVAIPIRAEVLGYSKEYLKIGKFLWNMGDGSEIQSANDTLFEYVYDYPGTYLVVFEYYRNPYGTEPDLVIRSNLTVADPGLQIKSVDAAGKITLLNSSDNEINLSGWWLTTGANTVYAFPRNTFLPSNKEVLFSAKALKLPLPITALSLVSPLGQVRATYPEAKTILPAKTNSSFVAKSFVAAFAPIVSRTVTTTTLQNAIEDMDSSPKTKTASLSSSSFVLFGLLVLFSCGAIFYLRTMKRKIADGEVAPIDEYSIQEE